MLNLTIRQQCWGFAIGSTLFALGSAPGAAALAGAPTTNLAYFVGSWFFTAAAVIQLELSNPMMRQDSTAPPLLTDRANWLAAAVQFLGTMLFNLSTGAAVWAHSISRERDLVWTPDAAGSLAFLLSGVLAVFALIAMASPPPVRSRGWWATWINLVGCIAFGASALGAFITKTGATVDASLANVGTFIGALCFLSAALLLLPARQPNVENVG